MTAHDLARRLITQTPCSTQACPFRVIQQDIQLLAQQDDPVAVVSEAVQYTEAQARTIVRVEAHALHRLLERLVAAEQEVQRLKTQVAR